MSVNFLMDIYGLTPMGKKIKIGHAKEAVETCHYVGGKIFYIDDSADGDYQFYDKYGEPIDEVHVGDTPYAYEVLTAGTKDKYYIYDDEMFTSKRWTYYKDGAYVYNSLGTENKIGKGKTNTSIVMAADNGAYVTADSSGVPTIWYQLSLFNNNTNGINTTGCDDWFIPSRLEVEALRNAIGYKVVTTSDDPVVLSAGAVTGGTIAGTADGATHYKDYSTTRTCYPSATKFLNNYIWSSSEYSAQLSWLWYSDGQLWLYRDKYYYSSVFFARAF